MSRRQSLFLTLPPWHRLTILCLAAVLLTGCEEPDLQDLRQFVAATKVDSPGKWPEPLPPVESYHPFAYTAQGLKDPFATSAFAKLPAARLAIGNNGIRPDPNRPQEALEKYALGSLKMVGTFQKDDLWGLIKAPDGTVHRVKKGNHLGTDHGRITAITEQRIDLKEIIPDGNMGWMERDAFLSLAE